MRVCQEWNLVLKYILPVAKMNSSRRFYIFAHSLVTAKFCIKFRN